MKSLKFNFAILLCLFACGCSSVGVGAKKKSVTRTADMKNERAQRRVAADRARDSADSFIIGDTRIHADQFARDNAKALAQKRSTATPQAYATFVQRRAAQWLNDAISETLLFEHASDKLPEKAGEQIDRYVDAEVRKIVTLSHGGSQRVYERQLAADGETLESVRKHIRRQIVISSFIDTNIKTSTTEPTRAELWQTYQASQHELQRPPRRRMSLIDIRVQHYLPEGVDTPSRDAYDSAKAKAHEVIRKIKADLASGASFAEIAKAQSHGLHAVDGGAWEWVTPGSVRERYEPAVVALYNLSQGDVSPEIDVSDGFLLVRCDEIDPGYTPSFADVQVELTAQIVRESNNRALMELVNELREKAKLDPNALDSFHRFIVKQELTRVADMDDTAAQTEGD